MAVGGGKISISLPQEQMTLSQQEILNWVNSAANAVSNYYGHFPVPHLTLQIRAGRGSRVGHGVTYPKGGGLIFITVGQQATPEDLNADWALTHEMVHLAFPNMEDSHHWIEEGLATYVEPVARTQTGWLPVEELWRQFARDMSKGEPEEGDQGLDQTHTWGRTYWGGAMFCLMADVQIRERTHNQKGLQDALRAIVNHGGTIVEDWDIKETLATGDKATGTRVLQELYAQMSDKPHPVDLADVWRKLGIELKDNKVIFNDKAPEASIRRAITAGHPSIPAAPISR